MGTAGKCCEHYQLLSRECLRSIYPYDGADETLADEAHAYLNRLRGGHTAAATAATSSAAALVAGLTDATPTSSNANIELERKAIGNVSRAMHLSDEDEEDDDGDAAHQAGDSLLSIVNTRGRRKDEEKRKNLDSILDANGAIGAAIHHHQ
jgi:hypothetical protein